LIGTRGIFQEEKIGDFCKKAFLQSKESLLQGQGQKGLREKVGSFEV